MQVQRKAVGIARTTVPVHERVLGENEAARDAALIFAASSIVNEIAAPTYSGATIMRTVQTEQGTYTLRGSRAVAADAAHPVLVVFVEPGKVEAESVAGTPPDPAAWTNEAWRRYRLTRKEVLVANLLAAGLSNEQVAQQLYISSHTARHHTQSVLGKLGIRSRTEVARMLRAG